jgi:hypothetical protein
MVHHTASRNSYSSPEEAAAEVRAVYQYHALVQGWGDIGYTALIDKFGNVYEGRHGRGGDPGDGLPGREALSAGISGGHTKWHNYGSAGVALIGDSLAPGWWMWEPRGPMWDALVRFCAFECARSFLRPVVPGSGGISWTSDFLRSDNAWHDNAPNLSGHRDSEQTFCPGDPVIALLPALREAVQEAIPAVSRTGPLFTALPPREAVPGMTLAYEWAPQDPGDGWAVAGYEHCLEAWFKPEDHDDLVYIAGYSEESQPQTAYSQASPASTSLTFRPARPGQYTLHVRELLWKDGLVRRAAFEAAHSCLVREA